ncbi:MAG: hypothetical protein U1A78_24900 [Polyangia bacterium]
MTPTRHRWKFIRSGGVDQVAIRDGADIAALESLDQKLWVALACPVHGLELDAKTLALIDTDKDGRIRVPEILGAIAWLKDALGSLDVLLKGGDELPLASIHRESALGKELLAAAQRAIAEAGADRPRDIIRLDEVASYEAHFAARPFNGDGIVVAEATGTPELAGAFSDIVATHGSVPDRSGKPGIDQARIDAFFAEAKLLVDWHNKAASDPGLHPLGDKSAAAAALVKELQPKIDDFFTRCRLASFDGRALTALNPTDAEYQALASKELSSTAQDLIKLPLARVEAGRTLPFGDGINPLFGSRMAELVPVLEGALGRRSALLTEPEWLELKSRLAPCLLWSAERPATKLDALSPQRLQELVAGKAHEELTALVNKDAAADTEYTQLAALLKLLLLQRDFVKLLNNFVNFSEFYSLEWAVFQAGSLYMDGRCCTLCLPVEDAGKHAALAALSRSYLAYCDCVRPGGEKRSIVAAFTGGDTDHLMVGRNGIFYDRKGRDWDATITKVVENPISIRQAFWAPYKAFVRMVEEQAAKRISTAEGEAGAKIKAAATEAATADQTKPGDKAAPPKKLDIGTVAAIGVAVGGIATFLSSVFAVFFGLGWWMPLGILAVMLSISLPSMAIAWLKLRQRTLAPLLDANGWAVNGFARINVPLGGRLTSVGSIPLGSERSLRDPFQEKQTPWRLYLVLAVLAGLAALWFFGRLDSYLPDNVKSATVLHRAAPAATPAAPADKK